MPSQKKRKRGEFNICLLISVCIHIFNDYIYAQSQNVEHTDWNNNHSGKKREGVVLRGNRKKKK